MLLPKVSLTQRRLRWGALVAILLLAAFLRLGQTGIVEFKRDEATLSRVALDFTNGESFPWLGIGSSVGYPNSPLNVYLLAIPYGVSDNPLIATLFIAFLNVIAIALLWRMTLRYFGSTAAFVAGILYATSPWAVIYSRKIWAQDMLAPFIILTVFTGVLGFFEGKRWAQVVHLPLLAITVQIHFGALSMIPVTLLLLALSWRRLRAAFVVSVMLAGLCSLPYLYGLYDANLLSLSALRASLQSGNPDDEARAHELSSTTAEYAWFSVAGTDIHSLAGADEFQAYLDSVPNAYPIFETLPVTLIMVMGVGSVIAWQQRDEKWLIWLAWSVCPVLLFTYTWAAPQPHYMIPMLPAAFMLIGYGVSWLTQHIPLGRYVAGVAMLTVVVLQIWLVRGLFVFLDGRTTPGGFSTPLHYQLEVRDAVLDVKPQRVLIVSDGKLPEFEQAPAVWDVMLDRLPNVDFLATEHLWVQPAQPALLLATSEAPPDTPWFQHIAESPDQIISQRHGEAPYQLWETFSIQTPQTWQQVDPRLYQNGVQINAWQFVDETLWLRWKTPTSSNNTLPIVFVHGMNANSERIQQVDLPFLAESTWQDGDSVYFKAPFALDDVVELRVGMYTLDGSTFSNIVQIDANGAYVDQWVSIELATD